MATFSYQPISPCFVKHAVITTYFTIQIKVIVTLLIIFETHKNLIQYQSEDSHAH